MRSLLFVPADSEKKLEKALESQADALILDLEDAVSAKAKPAARITAAEFLKGARKQAKRPRFFVRVNGLTTGLLDSDLAFVMPAGADGIVLPKTVGGSDIEHLGAKLAVYEAENGLKDGATTILAMPTENAAGVLALASLSGASPRLQGLAWSAEDLCADLGAEANRDEDGFYTEPYRLARSMILFAAASAKIPAIDAIYAKFKDLDGLVREAEKACRDGFKAKLAIHPDQVPLINAAFAPSETALQRAKAIKAAFEAQDDAGIVSLDGEMLDRPHWEWALRELKKSRILK